MFEFETGEAERSAAFEQMNWQDQPWHTLTNLGLNGRLLRQRQLESLLDDYRDLPDTPQVLKEHAGILAGLGEVSLRRGSGDATSFFEQALPINVMSATAPGRRPR